MKLTRLLIFIAILIILGDIAYFYPILSGKATNLMVEKAIVIRAIDGDTLETDMGKVRLLGINTPEKNQPYYREAKDLLAEYEGKEIQLITTKEQDNKDKYDRFLRYAFYDGKFLNAEILGNGLANFYSYADDKYTQTLKNAEEDAKNKEIGLWKKSSNYGCIKLIKLQYIEETRCNNQEQLILENDCEKMTIILKDDANHIYNLTIDNGLLTKNFSCVFNDAGDNLFIRDEEGLLLDYRY
jgi:endonuclease YncB( thermonuclease family)